MPQAISRLGNYILQITWVNVSQQGIRMNRFQENVFGGCTEHERLCDVDPAGQVCSSGDLWEDGSGTEKKSAEMP